MPTVEFQSLAETEQWAKNLVDSFQRPSLVLLDGELGAGKTQLVRWFVEALGGSAAASPTFAIHQTYESPGGNIEHVDLYRLVSLDELESAGLWDLLKTPNTLMFVEWASRLSSAIWPSNLRIHRIELHKSRSSEGRRVEISLSRRALVL